MPSWLPSPTPGSCGTGPLCPANHATRLLRNFAAIVPNCDSLHVPLLQGGHGWLAWSFLRHVHQMTPMDPVVAAAATLVDLLEERRRFALLQAGLDLIDQGIAVMDGDLKLVAANRGLFRLFGFPPEMSRVGTPF